MSLTFSTELVPAADRLDAWQWNARKFCGDCRFQFHNRRTFHGSIETKKAGSLDLSRFSSSSLRFAKFPIENAHAEKSCTVITQLEGMRSYSQNHRVVILNAGDSTLIDSALPWSSDCLGDCVRLYLRAPRWLIENRLRVTTLPVAHRISGTSTLGATLFHLANSLYREAEHLSPEEATAMIEAYFDIWSACVVHSGAEPGITRGSVELCSRIETFIEEHLADPALNPPTIAAAAGLSVRHLHRLFAHRGWTVGDWIRARRLERCRHDLADPRFRERTITDIAFYWGFSESAHFSRSFKKQFGVSPRTFRSQPCAGATAHEQTERIETLLSTSSRHSYPN
jgi:AraC family transcriptional activator of tynA and feaB